MRGPPGDAASLEGSHQLGNGASGQEGGRRTRIGREIRAGDRNVADAAGINFNLRVTDLTGE